MTATPACSIVMPCYNVSDTLPAQLDRLVPQLDLADAELILIDNNSSDETLALARSASTTNNRIVVATATDGQGVAYARNAGVQLARSDRFLFCDADDLVSEQWVESMSSALDEDSVATGSLDVETLNDAQLAASRGPARRPMFYGLFPIAAGGNMAVRRSAWDAVGPLNEELPSLEDMEWSLRASLEGIDIGWKPEAAIAYRYRTDAAALWSQGFAYGRSRAPIARRLHEETGQRPNMFAGLRSWVWLALHLPFAVMPSKRPSIAWVAGNRIGQLAGSVDARFLVL